ncbi:uncharacterized protein LOC126839633 [Adelges cooleyi]|uniref:uncharacterized protein LOC126839633 n=1 Tax=Adelges cooleyi TaxID=133065 RepID=UPI00218071E0|nr:uncharacterized protein LOC126839633 [Adelges cooleyi]
MNITGIRPITNTRATSMLRPMTPIGCCYRRHCISMVTVVLFVPFSVCVLSVTAAIVIDGKKNGSSGDMPEENLTGLLYSSNDAAVDTQYTSCKVITDHIVATAEGKFSRFCHGICNVNETNARLDKIESLLTVEAVNIKQRLLHIESVLSGANPQHSMPGKSTTTDTGTAGQQRRRQPEVDEYNGTVLAYGQQHRQTFTYYWRLDRFWRTVFVDGTARSPQFYVSPRGYRVRLVVESDLTARALRLAAAVVPGDYDAGLRWPMARRFLLAVLDQTDSGPADIVSRVWDETDVRCQPHADADAVCASMEFRHDVLTGRRYIADDALLVKLTVF